MSTYNTKNYTEQGGDVTHIGGKVVFDEGAESLMPNQEAGTSTTASNILAAVNALLVKLKNAGLMTADNWNTPTVTKSINDTVAGHANRQYNTEQISSVAVTGENDNFEITITLSKKVSELKDFDGGNGWGVHKWLGIGVQPWSNAITSLYYNGAELTAEDVTEAQSVGLDSAGYFVRWVAADLVLAGNNEEKSKGKFTIWADGFKTAYYTLKIVEPTE